jgi:hypothetical protein
MIQAALAVLAVVEDAALLVAQEHLVKVMQVRTAVLPQALVAAVEQEKLEDLTALVTVVMELKTISLE